jgi:hypothetical protein
LPIFSLIIFLKVTTTRYFADFAGLYGSWPLIFFGVTGDRWDWSEPEHYSQTRKGSGLHAGEVYEGQGW